jgi:tRNA(fMet)-specific endonuclease VapC
MIGFNARAPGEVVKYLLDTDAFSDIVRSVPNVAARFSSVSSSLVRISTVTIKEIEFGRRRHPERASRYGAAIDKLLKSVESLPFDIEDACATGQLRAVLTNAGTPIGPYDVMIAGTALARGLIVVTANTREFSRVPNLQIENWRLDLSEVREPPGEYRVARAGRKQMARKTVNELCATAAAPRRSLRSAGARTGGSATPLPITRRIGC